MSEAINVNKSEQAVANLLLSKPSPDRKDVLYDLLQSSNNRAHEMTLALIHLVTVLEFQRDNPDSPIPDNANEAIARANILLKRSRNSF